MKKKEYVDEYRKELKKAKRSIYMKTSPKPKPEVFNYAKDYQGTFVLPFNISSVKICNFAFSMFMSYPCAK